MPTLFPPKSRLIAALTLALVSVAFIACGGSSTEPTPVPPRPTRVATAVPTPRPTPLPTDDFSPNAARVSFLREVPSPPTPPATPVPLPLVNEFLPNVPSIVGIVAVENATPGLRVLARWYETGTIRQNLDSPGPDGVLVNENSFELTSSLVNPATNRATLRLDFAPPAPLVEDFYLVKVWVEGQLAATGGFVVRAPGASGTYPVSDLVQGPVSAGLTEETNFPVRNIRDVVQGDLKQFFAVVQVNDAKAGQKISGRWLQTGTLTALPHPSPDGSEFSKGEFTITSAGIDRGKFSKVLRLIPSSKLPPDTYILRIYLDGVPVRTVGFIVTP